VISGKMICEIGVINLMLPQKGAKFTKNKIEM